MEPSSADERPHPPGPELAWSESWTFDFSADDGSLGGWARLTLVPNRDVAWYHGFLAGPGRQLVAVLDHEVPLPSTGLEIRTTGLWADHICETALDHWTIGLEAFGLGVDDPAEIYGRQLGDQVPLGFDLEWEAEAPAHGVDGAYRQPSRVSGEILVGSDEIDFDGHGYRSHRWGVDRAWDRRRVCVAGRMDDGTWLTSEVVGGDLTNGTATVDGVDVELVEVSEALGPYGLPTGGRVRMGGIEVGVDPLAVTPLEVIDAEGRRVRAPRALCRFTDVRGRHGHGWAEWHQPQG